MPTLAEIREFARDRFELANIGAKVIKFSAKSALAESFRSGPMAKALGDHVEFASIDNYYGASYWSVVLSVDLRGSSSRAMKVGAKDTYLTMHTLLPTMIHLVGSFNGDVVGLRGDGLFAAFGLFETDSNESVTPSDANVASNNAVSCGKSMIEAVTEAVNPLLEKKDIMGDLAVGVGIDQGDVVITRIGHLSANELTAYGPAVNHACKQSVLNNQIWVTKAVQSIFPIGKGGRVKFLPRKAGKSGALVKYPSDYHVLQRGTEMRTRPK